MPTLRVMNDEEVQKLERPNTASNERQLIAQEYDAYLADYQPEQFVEVTLGDDEIKQNVRNRLNSAAGRRGWVLNFKRTKGQVLRFKVELDAGDEATEVFGHAHEEMEVSA